MGHKVYPLLRMVESLGGNRVRAFFDYGGKIKVVEMSIPWIKSTKNARIVDDGMGLDAGDGLEISAPSLWGMRKRIIVATQGRPLKRSSKKRTSRRAA